jgi:Ca2+:H+ antiporter
MASLLTVVSTSLLIPAALNVAYENHATRNSLNSILILSRGTAMTLIILYVLYLYFQLKTHSRLFEEGKTNCPQGVAEFQEPKEAATRVLSPPAAVATLLAVTVIIAICAEYLVGTIDDVVQDLHVNRTFIGLIVLPFIGNVAEYISAIMAASKHKMDLALGVALGSSMQIALFVTPFLVLLGWIIQQPMSLAFEPFGAVVFFLSVIVVAGLVPDGESNYLEGAMLVGMYATSSKASYL